jgi:hypothetical protein
MGKIELTTPVREKTLPVLLDAIERQKLLLQQSIGRTQDRIRQLATSLQVNPDLLLTGKIPHPETHDMDLIELEGELDLLRHLREQLEGLEYLKLCS